MVTVWPATLIVPVRAVAPLFGLAETRTDPLPDPALPDAIVIHGTLLLADHAHPVGAVTTTVTSSPAAATDARAGATS